MSRGSVSARLNAHGALLCGLLALVVRLAWVLSVPTRPVGDFAMYLESANHLVTWGYLDRGFIYMPGYVLLVALVKTLGGELLAIKLIGVAAGALSAAAAFGIARHLTSPISRDAGASADLRVAWLAGIAAALWPAGIAISSVAGTDMPAAALIAAAIWALCAWGPRRPLLGAALFGAVMGLAAYIRAVAFPLCTLSALYWLCLRPRPRWRDVALRTTVACAVALVVVLPWAVRNRVRNGDLRFTDYHGGITALIGSNPNSEGTYTRALNELFTRTTGRWVLDEPHGPVDDDAMAMAREWARWEPGYAAGLLVKKAEQLLDSEYRLLYWPVFRPGVLREPYQGWFASRQSFFYHLADAWWLTLVGLFAAGVALALVRRRWPALIGLPFQGALALTYVLFFAEPRYRLPIELLAFPLAATVPIWAMDVHRRVRARILRPLLIEAAVATLAVALIFAGWPRLLAAGARLRREHRWGTSTCMLAGRPHVCKWKRGEPGDSPVHGAPDAVGLDLAGVVPSRAVMESGGAPLPAGNHRVAVELVWPEAATSASVTIRGAGERVDRLERPTPETPISRWEAALVHPGGPLRLEVEARAAKPGTIWLQNLSVQASN